MLVAGLLAGALLGAGIVLVARGLLAPPEPLAVALDRLTVADRGRPALVPTTLRAANRLAETARRIGVSSSVADADLRITERTVEHHLVEKLAATVAGIALPPALGVVMRLGGVAVPISLLTLGSLALALAGFVLPDALLRSHAAERRRAFRYALSSYLDLVNVILAAGSGVETALHDAATAGQGWAFQQLRSALDRARLSGGSPWRAFGQLGVDLDVAELREVASSFDLAGSHGARVRSSLEARARAMRTRDLAETEAEAEAATERMSIPSVVLVVGFIVFVGFPAAHEILGF